MRVISKESQPQEFPSGYTIKQAQELLHVPESRIRSFVQAGFLEPRRGERGAYRFSFQDLVLLRTAKELSEEVSPRKIKKALSALRERLPRGKALSSLRITAEGDEIVVREGGDKWQPESGQTLINFEVREMALDIAPLARQAAQAAHQGLHELVVEDWFELGCDLEATDSAGAARAYERALEADPHHADAHINLGRLHHEANRLQEAEEHYRLASEIRPRDATAAYDLAVVLQDQGLLHDARRQYYRVLGLDPDFADAHFNLAHLYAAAGMPKMAERHRRTYRRLSREQN